MNMKSLMATTLALVMLGASGWSAAATATQAAEGAKSGPQDKGRDMMKDHMMGGGMMGSCPIIGQLPIMPPPIMWSFIMSRPLSCGPDLAPSAAWVAVAAADQPLAPSMTRARVVAISDFIFMSISLSNWIQLARTNP